MRVPLEIRPVEERDVELLMELILELAHYEKMTPDVVATPDSLRRVLFGNCAVAEALLAYWEGAPAGYAFFFSSCSTFLARAGIYLEDIYVRPHLRGKGIGKTLLAKIARIAVERKCGRLEWSVLNWNEPAIRFYEHIGAEPLSEWTMFRLAGESLQRVAQCEPTADQPT